MSDQENRNQQFQQYNPNQDIRKDKPMAKEDREKERKQANDPDANFRRDNEPKRNPEKEKRAGSNY